MNNNELRVDVAIIGAGTAGGNAMKEVKSAGKSFVLIDHGPLGTTCARVGCMPSKAVLHAGAKWHGLAVPAASEGEIRPDSLWNAAIRTRDALAAGAASRTAAAAGEHLLMGQARFVAPNIVEVDGRRVTATAFVIATGSKPVLPAFLHEIQDRVLTTDSLFELDALPRSVGILGLGAIGLEIGLALSRLGVRVVAGDIKSRLAGIADPEVGMRAAAYFGKASNLTMWLGRPVTVSRAPGGVSISNGEATEQVDVVLAALGRKPALDALQLHLAGVELDDKGMPAVDPHTMRAGQSALYFAGDAVADRPLLHEAADEGAIAGWNAARHGAATRFRRRVPLSIVFSDPDIAAVGNAFEQLDPSQTIIGSSVGQANGRARVIAVEDNLVRIYAHRATGALLGASIFAVRGEHVAHLLAWAIQRGETAESLLEMPFYHPTIEEMVQSALAEIVKQQAIGPKKPAGLRILDESVQER